MKDKTIDAEIVEDEFKAPILKDIKYPVSEDVLKSLVEKYSEIPDIDLDADDEIVAAQYKIVRDGHIELAKKRNEIEKTRKAIKDPAFTFGKNVDAFAKKLQAIIADTEIKLKFQRDKVDQNEARKQREVEEAEELRVDKIKKSLNALKDAPTLCINKDSETISKFLDLMEFPDREHFEEFYDESIELYNATISLLKQMVENQLLVENAQKIQDEADAKAKEVEDARLLKQKEDQDKLDKERDEFREEKRKFAQQQQDIQDEADKKQADKDADELLKKQETDKLLKDIADKELHGRHYNEALNHIHSTMAPGDILDAIIKGAIPHIKWIPDGN
jgi:hypothetical protein